MFFKICSMTSLAYSIITSKKKDFPFPICKHHCMKSTTSILHISASVFSGSWISVRYLNTRKHWMPSSMWHHLYYVNASQRIRPFFAFGTRHQCDRWVSVGSTCKSPVEVSWPTSCVKDVTYLIEDSTSNYIAFNPETLKLQLRKWEPNTLLWLSGDKAIIWQS